MTQKGSSEGERPNAIEAEEGNPTKPTAAELTAG